jgi:hypothetical protein
MWEISCEERQKIVKAVASSFCRDRISQSKKLYSCIFAIQLFLLKKRKEKQKNGGLQDSLPGAKR